MQLFASVYKLRKFAAKQSTLLVTGEANVTSEEIIGGEGKFSDVYWTAGGIGQVPGGALANIYNSENWILSRFTFEALFPTHRPLWQKPSVSCSLRSRQFSSYESQERERETTKRPRDSHQFPKE